MIATTILLAVPGHRGTERGAVRVDRLGIQARVAGIIVVVRFVVGDFGRDPGFGDLSSQEFNVSCVTAGEGCICMYIPACWEGCLYYAQSFQLIVVLIIVVDMKGGFIVKRDEEKRRENLQ